MQAIQTKYLCPTNHKGSRIKATCAAKTIVVDWDYELSIEENHGSAATILLDKLGWYGNTVSGTLIDGSFVHVFMD